MNRQQVYNHVLTAYREAEEVNGHHDQVVKTRRKDFVSKCLPIIGRGKLQKHLNYLEVGELINEIISDSDKTSELVNRISKLLHDILTDPHHELFENRDQGELF